MHDNNVVDAQHIASRHNNFIKKQFKLKWEVLINSARK